MMYEYYTPKQIAEILGLVESTILKYIKQGKLGAIALQKGYRIPKKDFDQFLEKNTDKV